MVLKFSESISVLLVGEVFPQSKRNIGLGDWRNSKTDRGLTGSKHGICHRIELKGNMCNNTQESKTTSCCLE